MECVQALQVMKMWNNNAIFAGKEKRAKMKQRLPICEYITLFFCRFAYACAIGNEFFHHPVEISTFKSVTIEHEMLVIVSHYRFFSLTQIKIGVCIFEFLRDQCECGLWWLEFDFDRKYSFRVQRHLLCQCWSSYLFEGLPLYFHYTTNCLVIAVKPSRSNEEVQCFSVLRQIQTFISLAYFSKSVIMVNF